VMAGLPANCYTLLYFTFTLHTVGLRCGASFSAWLQLQFWLMPQSPHCLRNDVKCV